MGGGPVPCTADWVRPSPCREERLSRQAARLSLPPIPLATAGALVLAILGILLIRPGQVEAQEALAGAVQGTVVDGRTRLPVEGARIDLVELGRTASSDSGGRFSWDGIDAPSDGLPVTIAVRASGFGDWVMRDVLVLPNDTLLLDVALDVDPVEIVIPPPRSETPAWLQTDAIETVRGAAGDQMDEPIPSTIRVRVTNYAYCDTTRPYTVQTVDFKEYVKHVLPNEWITSWPTESLRAGAMAVKMYAWQIVADGGKWNDADVYDSTCDQVYNANRSYASTDRAVDFTWNWRLTKDGMLVRTAYRALYSQCLDANKAGRCMAQWDTYYHAIGNNGYDKLTWDEMLYRYYVGTVLTPVWDPPGGWSLRYYGNGYGDLDRVKIPLDSPARPVDVGAGDFSLEWWMKASLADNRSTSVTCGAVDGWNTGNILIDRDVFGDGDLGDFGVSIASGRLAFGAAIGSNGTTLCGSRSVADGTWHHVAVTRRASDGRIQIYVDGALDAEGYGPVGDMSYADGRASSHPNDPYLVLGAEKHDAGAAYPSFSGWIDDLRVSRILRYDGSFTRPAGRLSTDADTVALYPFNEGFGNTIHDVSGAGGGPSHGLRIYGGVTNGPEWTTDSPWFVAQPTPTPYRTSTAPTPTRTSTATPTGTPTPGPSDTPTPTASPTASPSPTSTRTPTATSTPAGTPTPASPPDLAGDLTFQPIASGLSQPLFVTHAGDGSGRLFVLERAGRIRIIDPGGSLRSTAFLDIAALVGDGGSEQGLLGLAFHPNYGANGQFFVVYTDNGGAVILARYAASGDPNQADASSAQILLTVPQPASNHNGGMLTFGPDGYLYLGLGDGGGAGDPENNAQTRTNLLGKILRLDVNSASPYGIPPENPFVTDPDPSVRHEIWAYGLRNPWRFSFDRARGDLWIGDVGQGSREEIDFEPSTSPGGQNYGWRVMEGSLCFNPSTGCDPSGKILPVAEYSHASGNCSVTGGYVYRGSLSPALRGVYLYGDFCSGRIWGLSQTSPGVWVGGELADTGYTISSFGEDGAGELLLTDYASGSVVRISGPVPPTPTPTSTPGSPTTGDVSSDGVVNVIDVQLCVNIILGTESDPGRTGRADVNGDGGVDVLDVQRIVNIILAG